MSDARPEPGQTMAFQFRKWDGSPHWRRECIYLGADEWGDWLGQPAGWHSERQGKTYTARVSCVLLLPRVSAGQGAPGADRMVTVHNRRTEGMRIYIDLTWDARWTEDPLLATGIDMDLDVVRCLDERGSWVDDRDEWEEHRVRYGYPADIVAHLEALALELEQDVRAEVAPYDDATSAPWLARLDAYGLDRPLPEG